MPGLLEWEWTNREVRIALRMMLILGLIGGIGIGGSVVGLVWYYNA